MAARLDLVFCHCSLSIMGTLSHRICDTVVEIETSAVFKYMYWSKGLVNNYKVCVCGGGGGLQNGRAGGAC